MASTGERTLPTVLPPVTRVPGGMRSRVVADTVPADDFKRMYTTPTGHESVSPRCLGVPTWQSTFSTRLSKEILEGGEKPLIKGHHLPLNPPTTSSLSILLSRLHCNTNPTIK